jgi:hypothetical protein
MTDEREPMHVVCFFGGAGQHQAAWRSAEATSSRSPRSSSTPNSRRAPNAG